MAQLIIENFWVQHAVNFYVFFLYFLIDKKNQVCSLTLKDFKDVSEEGNCTYIKQGFLSKCLLGSWLF
jgi:hypothetical protein